MAETITTSMFSKYIENIQDNGQLQKQVFDLAGMIARKKQIRLAGKPPIHTSSSEEIRKEMEQIAKEIDLQTIMHQYVYDKSTRGVARLAPSINSDGTASVVAEEIQYANKVVRYNNVPIYAIIWRTLTFNRVEYRIREVWDFEKVEREVFGQGNRMIKAESFNAKLPKGLFIKRVEYHNLGMLPVVEGFNYPTLNYTQPQLQTDLANAPKLQNLLNNSTFAFQRELRNNITRIFLDQGYLDGLSEQQQMAAADADIMVGLDGTDTKDGALPITILQGDPKLTEYMNAFETIFEAAGIAAGASLSIKDKSSDGSATGTLFAAANDVEHLNDQTITMQKDMRELMVKIYHMKKNITIDRSKMLDFDYELSIVPNIMTDEIKKTETIIKQLASGLISDVKAKMTLDGISQEQAEVELKDVEEIAIEKQEDGDNPIDKTQAVEAKEGK